MLVILSVGMFGVAGCADSSTEMAHPAPTVAGEFSSPDCAEGVELATADLSTGTVRILDAGDRFCFTSDRGDPVEIPIAPRTVVPVPTMMSSGAFDTQGQWHLVGLPPGTGEVVIRDEVGDTVLSVRSTDGSYLLIYDTGVSGAQTPPENYVERVWELVGADGSVIDQLVIHSPPAGTAPTDIMEVLTCLEQQGLHLDIETSPAPTHSAAATPDVQPYPPEVASSAWRECRHLMIAALEDLDTSAAKITLSMAVYDCMADLGWIQAFTGIEADVEARGDAVERCRAGAAQAWGR